MKFNTYIAILLVSIFMGKFIAVDANGLNLLIGDGNISFVNPHCKNENHPKQSKKTADFSKVDLETSEIIPLSGFCTPQFEFKDIPWETNFSRPIAVFVNEHFSSALSYLYLEQVSPPPRLARLS